MTLHTNLRAVAWLVPTGTHVLVSWWPWFVMQWLQTVNMLISSYNRPCFFMVSLHLPTDSWHKAKLCLLEHKYSTFRLNVTVTFPWRMSRELHSSQMCLYCWYLLGSGNIIWTCKQHIQQKSVFTVVLSRMPSIYTAAVDESKTLVSHHSFNCCWTLWKFNT